MSMNDSTGLTVVPLSIRIFPIIGHGKGPGG